MPKMCFATVTGGIGEETAQALDACCSANTGTCPINAALPASSAATTLVTHTHTFPRTHTNELHQLLQTKLEIAESVGGDAAVGFGMGREGAGIAIGAWVG